MFSDYVIISLYMRVLKLTWKNLISMSFPQFSNVSVWSVWTEKWYGWYSLGVRTGIEPNRPDGTYLHPDARGNHRANS
jgi:hypothetical protein